MSSDDLHQLLQTGIQAAQSGNKAIAQGIFRQILDTDPDNDLAWTWLATVADTVSDRREYLQKALALNPTNTRARQALEKWHSLPGDQLSPADSGLRAALPPDALDRLTRESVRSNPLEGLSFRQVLSFVIAILALGMIAAGLIMLRDEIDQQATGTPPTQPPVGAALAQATSTGPFLGYVSPTPFGGTPGTPRPEFTPAPWTPSPTWTPQPTPLPTVTPPVLGAYSLVISSRPAGQADWELFEIDTSKPGLTRIRFSQPANDQGYTLRETFGAAWSPDGHSIVFTGVVEESDTGAVYEELFLAQPDGGPVVRLTTWQAPRTREADWSPNGDQIVFASDYDGDYDIYTITVGPDAAGDPIPLTTNAVIDRSPAWSPDGNWIAFSSDRAAPGALAIWRMTANGQNAIQLTGNAYNSHSPTWSPDGRRMAFLSDQNVVLDIYLMDADGQRQRPLLIDDFPAEERDPAWSTDGHWIAFSSNRNSPAFELFVVRPDGTGLTPLTAEEGTIRYATWKP